MHGEFTYSVPEALRAGIQVGQRIEVPFGRGKALAFVLGEGTAPGPELLPKVKPVARLLETVPSLTPDVVALVQFAASHYRYPVGEALKGALPPGWTATESAPQSRPDVATFVSLAEGFDVSTLARAPLQMAAASYLAAVGGRALLEEVDAAIPGAKEALKRARAKGWVIFTAVATASTVTAGLESGRPDSLTSEQAHAVSSLVEALSASAFRPFLLQGVTGSGKTEVYLRLVEAALAKGRGALILVPEIALTPQLVGRFRSRFGEQIEVLHSGLKDRERANAWLKLRSGEVRIAVGVRSAIFAPVVNLGVVVVDEEHDSSFKQDEKLRYQARDLAVVRARDVGAVLVLGSATPSLESLENVRRGRFALLELQRRVDDRPMPTLELVDLRVAKQAVATPVRADAEPTVLSPALVEAMRVTLSRNQQVILFLNRRGYSTFWVCETCGENVRCRECDVSMTHHLSVSQLQCHYCGRRESAPAHCPSCSGRLLQLGLGTERVEAQVSALFPQARVGRLDRDAVTTAESLTGLLASFARRELDVLVGTQMVAKGHDFPGVTLVAIVAADTALALPDFRASERTFQLLTQVAGRAGRGRDPGRVLVQTYHPEAQPIARMLAHDFTGFSTEELRRRQALAWPPFSRLAMVRIEGPTPEATADAAKRLAHAMAKKLPAPEAGVRLLGPAPAPVARVKGRSRWQLLVKGPTHASLRGPLLAAEEVAATFSTSIKVVLDVDPGSML